VNPFGEISDKNYTFAIKRKYFAKESHIENPAHIFASAENALKTLQRDDADVCIVLTG